MRLQRYVFFFIYAIKLCFLFVSGLFRLRRCLPAGPHFPSLSLTDGMRLLPVCCAYTRCLLPSHYRVTTVSRRAVFLVPAHPDTHALSHAHTSNNTYTLTRLYTQDKHILTRIYTKKVLGFIKSILILFFSCLFHKNVIPLQAFLRKTKGTHKQ